MKKIFFLLFGIIICNDNYSQVKKPIPIEGTNPYYYEEILTKTPYVFEGEITDTMYYNGETGTTDITIRKGENPNPVKGYLLALGFFLAFLFQVMFT